MEDRVVITGAGLVSSLGNSAGDTWDALLAGKSGIQTIKDFDTRGFNCHAAAQVAGLTPGGLNVHPRDSRIMDMHSYMLLKAGRDAFRDAKLDEASISPEEIGYYGAMGMVDYNIEDLLPSVLKSIDGQGRLDYHRFFAGAFQDIHPLWPLSMLNNISFCQVAIDLGIRGENTTFSPHADSAVHSIVEACHTLIEKKARVVLAGGVSEKVSPLSMARASWSGVLNEDDSACSPFSREGRGIILGEGCGMMVLELLSSAKKRGVYCLGEVTGCGASFGKEAQVNCPTSDAVALSMGAALSTAGKEPTDIDLIIAHGDGTAAGDRNEIEAIHKIFEGCLYELNIFSSKGALGHLLSGAPAADMVLGTYMLKHGIIPAVSGAAPFQEDIGSRVVRGEPLKKDINRILINAQSCEGQCASLIIEKGET